MGVCGDRLCGAWSLRCPRRRVSVSYWKGHPMMRISARRYRGQPGSAFTLRELLVVVACVTLAAVLLPILAKSERRSSRVNCANNLKQVGLAFRVWALDNQDLLPMQVSVTNGGTMELVASGVVSPHFEVMSNELSTPRILFCPADEKRTNATIFVGLRDTNVSYFVNMDAKSGDGSRLLCGDRTLTNRAGPGGGLVPLTAADTIGWTKEMHQGKGNLGFGDGGVSGFSNGIVRGAVGGGTNWVAVP